MPTSPLLPHDLLWVAPGSLCLEGPWPDWADASWLRAAPVVVRRDAVGEGMVPVGLRGLARNQRAKATVPAGAVLRRMAPEALVAAIGSGDRPALAALAAVAPALNATGLAWGPTGGVGFFLASGLPVLRPGSDLDLLVRASAPLTKAQADALDGIRANAACNIDIQVDTGCGAFAFAEWRRGGRVMLKTDNGPRLMATPWPILATEAA